MRVPRIHFLFLSGITALLALATACQSEEEQPKLPVITSFTPLAGEPGTIITIQGANFTTSPTFYINNVKATLNGTFAENSTEVQIIAPAGVSSGKIKLETKEGAVESSDIFNVFGLPTITTFSPATGNTGTEVVINGTNFTATTEIRFAADIKAQITSLTGTRLTVLVPQGARPGKLTIKTAVGSDTSTTDFTANPPVILEVLTYHDKVPVTFTGPGHMLFLRATNFSSVAADNKIKFNGKEVIFISLETDRFYFKIPSGASTGKITLTLGSYTAEYNQVIEVPPGEWKQLTDFPDSRFDGKVFVIGNEAFYGGTPNPLLGQAERKDFWKFTPGTNAWSRIADIGEIKNNSVAFAAGNKGYVGGGTNGELYEYNPVADAWTKKAKPFFYGTKAAGINGKGYLLTDLNITSFSEYDPAQDKWTTKANFPLASCYYPAMFVLNSKLYVVSGMTDSGTATFTKEVYAYDPVTNQWTKKADFPGVGRTRAGAFVINGSAYVGGGDKGNVGTTYEDVWRYDDVQDKWFPSVPHPGFFTNAFAIGGKAYSGLAGGGDNLVGRNFFYEFTP